MQTIIYNKQLTKSDTPCIHYNDRGYTLGHGLFETILVKKGAIAALDHHWKRLEASAPIIGVIVPFTFLELESMITRLIIENGLQDTIAVARVTLTHGESDRGLLPLQQPQPNFLISVFEYTPVTRPFTALIVNTRKNEHSAAARVKSISYLDNILAKQEAMSQGYDEAILLNTASNIADGAISNIFMVKNDQIFTPPLSDGALPGVMRSILLQECNQIFPIIETSITSTELLLADEVFLTNALIGIKSVHKMNMKEFSSFLTANKLEKILREKNYI